MRHVSALLAGLLMLFAVATPASAQALLEQRVERLEAESAIRALLVRYGATLDARDYDDYAALFADQGVWIGSYGTFTGREAIRRMLDDNMGVPVEGVRNTSNFHMLTSPLITVMGNSAHADSHFLFWVRNADGRPSPLMAGRYEDEFVNERGVWKIARRKAWGVIPWSDPENAPAAATPTASPAPDPGDTVESQSRLRNQP
jgi:ketosteroid isomerase-like protein